MAIEDSNQCRVKFKIDKKTGRIKDMEVSGGDECSRHANRIKKSYEGW